MESGLAGMSYTGFWQMRQVPGKQEKKQILNEYLRNETPLGYTRTQMASVVSLEEKYLRMLHL